MKKSFSKWTTINPLNKIFKIIQRGDLELENFRALRNYKIFQNPKLHILRRSGVDSDSKLRGSKFPLTEIGRKSRKLKGFFFPQNQEFDKFPGVRNSMGAAVSENRPNGVATVAEFVESVPVRDHGEPGATGESGSVSRGPGRHGAARWALSARPARRGSANRRRRPTYEATTTRGRLRTSVRTTGST